MDIFDNTKQSKILMKRNIFFFFTLTNKKHFLHLYKSYKMKNHFKITARNWESYRLKQSRILISFNSLQVDCKSESEPGS